MGSKEGTYCMVHWVLHATNESSNLTSETRDVLYGDQHNVIKKNIKKIKIKSCRRRHSIKTIRQPLKIIGTL